MCVYVCVCVCVPARSAPKRTGKLQFELRARPNDQIHTKICHNGQLREYSIKQFVLSGPELFGENPMCVNILP